MLVLARPVGEEIVIGNLVRVGIVAVQNYSVKVGVTAPSHVTAHREEDYQRLKGFHDGPENAEQNENAAWRE